MKLTELVETRVAFSLSKEAGLFLLGGSHCGWLRGYVISYVTNMWLHESCQQ
jgi:hypothetical protein